MVEILVNSWEQMQVVFPLPFFSQIKTSWLEVLSSILSILTVWLAIRQNQWNWLFAIISSALYAVVFYQSKLYGDMCLQFLFIAMAVWGWSNWLGYFHSCQGRGFRQKLRVTRMHAFDYALSVILLLIFFVAWFSVLKLQTDTDVPVPDALLTAASIVTVLFAGMKKVEHWWYWVVIDLLYVPLYVYKQLWFTAALYLLFVVMAYQGYRTWTKAYPTASLEKIGGL